MKYIKCTETDRSDCLDMHTTTIINRYTIHISRKENNISFNTRHLVNIARS